MIGRAVWTALKAEKKQGLSVDKLYLMGDDSLLEWLSKCGIPLAEKIGRMLQARQLYKRADHVERQTVLADQTQDRLARLDGTLRKNAAKRVAIENEIADLSGLEEGDVLFYCPDPKMNLKAADMLVTWREDVIPLRKIDDPVIRSRADNIIKSHENLWQCKVFIHPAKRHDAEAVGRVRELSKSHLQEQGDYDRETIAQIVLDLAEESKISMAASNSRDVASSVLAKTRGGSPITRSLLLTEVRRFLGKE
jgi:hypothetical protein